MKTQAPPTLSESYSGVPSRLAAIAQEAKDRLYSHKTVPESVPRQHNVRLPPDTSRETFDEAVASLRQALGHENVVLNDKPLVDGWYLEHPNTHDAFHVVDQEELVCSAIAYPASTTEVQAIVKWANNYGIPIYPISMGRNVGYGGSAPRVPGSVVVDLGKRMNKILKTDADNASCVVEPGVSYFALYEEIQRRKLPFWIDCPDLGGGSVLGNAVDRGVGYTPMGDHFANHCGMEIVLPNGELLRTGMGALPGKNGADNPTWQSFQPAYGPYSDGIFSQSNFGIVCQMGFWLMHETGHQSYMLTFPRDEDFTDIVEAIRPLAQKGLLGNIPQLRHVAQELNVTGLPKSHWYSGPDPIPRDVIRKQAAQLPCGDCSWVFYGTQYGDAASIKTQLDIIKSAFSKIKGSKFYLPNDVPPDHYLHSRALVCSGVPVLRELDWLNWKPNAAHLFFSPITPTRGEDAQIVHNINVRLHKKYGFDLFPTLCVAGREMHYITNIIYDRSSDDEKRRAAALMRELIAEAASEGYGEYRTHLLFADQVARTYSWNNNALMRFNETIKDALDPNGILAPGRNGIWPKKYRGKGWELLGDSVEKAVGGRTISPDKVPSKL
ncbi:vanillyl alcohol oxidase [Trematosphaeria pertusa]|uniref:Vanillyl alcohol oxidase n=1 Tax=Trematosphaeria pertusa TaxID=390896 RepID=A0A6A6INH2_9PLEO|nr:vanillyl alcohol oxidase [Trematosphaeria pertusa]KAF2251120.1 vanillyl alcohol oxidase [Trematosphaeria pertusa]